MYRTGGGQDDDEPPRNTAAGAWAAARGPAERTVADRAQRMARMDELLGRILSAKSETAVMGG